MLIHCDVLQAVTVVVTMAAASRIESSLLDSQLHTFICT